MSLSCDLIASCLSLLLGSLFSAEKSQASVLCLDGLAGGADMFRAGIIAICSDRILPFFGRVSYNPDNN